MLGEDDVVLGRQAGVADGVGDAAGAVGAGVRLLQAREVGAVGLGADLVHVLGRDAHGVGDLAGAGRAAEHGGEVLGGLGGLAGAGAGAAGGPVGAAQLVDDGSAHPGAGVRGEGDAGLLAPRAGRLQQPLDAGAGQVVAVDVRGQAADELADAVPDQRQVGQHQGVDLVAGRCEGAASATGARGRRRGSAHHVLVRAGGGLEGPSG